MTNWFQNKRQTVKRKSLVWRADSHGRPPPTGSPPHQNSRLQSTASLDRIASLHEKPTGPTTISTLSLQTPFTPRDINGQVHTSLGDDQLWQHMPSSPIIPPSSPAADSSRMSILPSHSKTRKSLEWACAKARAEKYEEGDEEEGCIPDTTSRKQSCKDILTDSDETDTESEPDEAIITPDTSANFSPFLIMKDSISLQEKQNLDANLCLVHHQEDLDAAIALLGFMGR